MAKIKPSLVPEQSVPVVPEDGLRRLLDVCAGRDFDARRDTVIILLLLDAGPRVGELAGMRVKDVDFDLEVVGVLVRLGRADTPDRPGTLRLERPPRNDGGYPAWHGSSTYTWVVLARHTD